MFLIGSSVLIWVGASCPNSKFPRLKDKVWMGFGLRWVRQTWTDEITTGRAEVSAVRKKKHARFLPQSLPAPPGLGDRLYQHHLFDPPHATRHNCRLPTPEPARGCFSVWMGFGLGLKEKL
ncbi:hypothetical protein Acr_08g0018090 [Actinidia rufa]|uniref:Uncharacterized protein n=1 Tax=Actinidia rufa TaxID=165716 RepID=A0A7J0F474_9ERIC|nr:hypothetical protein Acr_08g0018090 [Actinidia rufa]